MANPHQTVMPPISWPAVNYTGNPLDQEVSRMGNLHVLGQLRVEGGVDGAGPPALKNGTYYFVDTANGDDTLDGKTWLTAFKTVQHAVDTVVSYDIIFVSGAIAEAVVTPVDGASGAGDGPLYVRLISARNHGYPDGDEWTSGAAGSPNLILRARGWSVEGFNFRCPTATEAIRCLYSYTDALVYEDIVTCPNLAYDIQIKGCRFFWGLHAIGAYGVAFEYQIRNNIFEFVGVVGATGRAIRSVGVGYAAPYRWFITGNQFQDCAGFIDFSNVGANGCVIAGNILQGVGLVSSYAHKIDLGGGFGDSGNMITGNTLGGTYSIIGGYVKANANDNWFGNYVSTGISSAVPG